MAKTCFKTIGLKCLKLVLNILNFPMFEPNVPMYHWRIQTNWNDPWQLGNWKQGSGMSGAVEGECIQFMTEHPSRDSFV